MKLHIIATAVCALALATSLCLAPASSHAQNGATGPIKPGSVRVTTRAPEADKWNAQRSANGTRRVFKCKPLACPDPQTVSFIFSKSPTRHPDPKALERLAKVDLPKSIRAAAAAREVLSDGTEKIETLASETATLKGYPSVVNESKMSRGSVASFIQTAIIFAGPVMIRVQSSSQNQDLAKTALKQFIDVMRIEEGPPAEPSRPPGAKSPTQSL
jgi:hypothetical protein